MRELDLALKSSDRDLKSRALQSQGTILVTLGRNREAIAPLVAGLELGGNNADANVIRSNLAVCYARTGQIGKARELDDALQKSASKTATDAARTASLMALADAAQQAGQRTWAEELWQRVTDGDGPAAMRWQAFYELGRSQLSANQATESLATSEPMFQTLAREATESPTPMMMSGAALTQRSCHLRGLVRGRVKISMTAPTPL